ncbi:hypothetical protein ACA910_005788 [Epithemia clementina (nom. ined.)]
MQHTLAWLQREFGQDVDTQNAPLQTHAIPVEEAEEEKENEEEEKYKENEEDKEDKEEREEDSERVGRANQIHQIQDNDDNEGGPPTVTEPPILRRQEEKRPSDNAASIPSEQKEGRWIPFKLVTALKYYKQVVFLRTRTGEKSKR